MIVVGNSSATVSKLGSAKIVVNIQDICQERFGKYFFLVHLLQLPGHENTLEGDLVPRPGHAEEPGDPLEEDDPDLKEKYLINIWLQHHSNLPSPACCGCGPSGGGS